MRSFSTALRMHTPGDQSFQIAKDGVSLPPSEGQEWRLDKLGPVLVAWLVLYAIAIVGSLGESHVATTAELEAGFDRILIASVP